MREKFEMQIHHVEIKNSEQAFDTSVNSDASGLVLLGLGNNNGEDAILEVGADLVLVHARREVEASRELANAALGEPVLGLVGRLVALHFRWLGSGGAGWSVRGLGARFVGLGLGFVLNGCLARVSGLLALSDSTAHAIFELASGRSASGVGAFDFAADEQSLRFSELDLHIVLADAGELAVELVGVVNFADIELGLELRESSPTAVLSSALTRVCVKVVEETEERGEGGVGVVNVAREESHCGCLVGGGFQGDLLE
jgi:hypothetical protein